ncbi:sensor histidine kinase [Massilia sp. 2TAF26]|uniref:sensor histidine kinase n=1 Tax=Massilia sp. 2TAF26 TaxID=3233012 RepID=UPI003F9490AA
MSSSKSLPLFRLRGNTAVTLRNVGLLTAWSLIVVVVWGMIILSLRSLSPIVAVLGFVLVQAAYFAFAVRLGRPAPARTVCRYAAALQLQAFIEHTAFWLVAILTLLAIIFMNSDVETEARIRQAVTAPDALQGMLGYLVTLPALALLTGVWRLHHLGYTTGALAGVADGSLLRKSVRLSGDAGEVHDVLVRRLERLMDSSTPGLDRPLTGGLPRLVAVREANALHYELIWPNCSPNKLMVSLRTGSDAVPEVEVECRLRDGIYRCYLFAPPADAVAQMQYIEAHLLQPLRAELSMLSAERQRDALREQAVEAQLRILQAQIEPHFLFNSLANVRHLYREDVGAGEHMLDHLIAYLRCAMDDLRAEHSSVRKEMDLARHYLTIMQIRMGERLGYTFTATDALLEHPFPPAMLISLVENAIKHGLADAERGTISLAAAADDACLRLTVADDGRGFSSVGGTGVGLSNIRRRLEAMYGNRAWLEVGAPPSGGFAATIVIPLEPPP